MRQWMVVAILSSLAACGGASPGVSDMLRQSPQGGDMAALPASGADMSLPASCVGGELTHCGDRWFVLCNSDASHPGVGYYFGSDGSDICDGNDAHECGAALAQFCMQIGMCDSTPTICPNGSRSYYVCTVWGHNGSKFLATQDMKSKICDGTADSTACMTALQTYCK